MGRGSRWVGDLRARDHVAYRASAWLKQHLLIKRRHPRAFARYSFVRALAGAARVQEAHGLVPVRLVDGQAFLDTPTGFLLLYNVRSKAHTIGDGQSLEFVASYGPDLLGEVVLGALPSDGVYLDVGANNGYYYALQVARRHPGVRVLAFEPDPQIALHLERNVAANAAVSVEVVRLGLADEPGGARLSAGLGASNFVVAPGDAGTPSIEIEVDTLDRVVAARAVERVDVIKVDIEGGEYRFLLGARATLERFRPIVAIELRPELLARRGDAYEAVLGLVADLGYAAFRVPGSADVVLVPADRMGAVPVDRLEALDS